VIHLHPYKLGSGSARDLKEYLTTHGKRAIISHNLRRPSGRLIVGWGARSFDFDPAQNHIINHPDDTKIVSCKKKFFDHVQNKAVIPEYTSDPGVARSWMDTVVVRSTTTGSGGDGITLVQPGEELPVAPLYVRYQKKTKEYRVHCFKTDAWQLKHFQQKVFVKTEERPEPVNWQIRNHSMGFTFQTVETIPPEVEASCQSVLESFPNLSFIALDVIFHKPSRLALVLEGNTAPGLEPQRLELYGQFLADEHTRIFGP
jgi:hypothetical protein